MAAYSYNSGQEVFGPFYHRTTTGWEGWDWSESGSGQSDSSYFESTAYSPTDTIGIYQTADSSTSDSSDSARGYSNYTQTKQLYPGEHSTETWGGQWHQSDVSHSQSSYGEAGIETAAGAVGDYNSTDSGWDDYDWEASGHDEYAYCGPNQGPVKSNSHHFRWGESEQVDSSSSYTERGVFGPGGDQGKYASNESCTDCWDYSGSGGSSGSYEDLTTSSSSSDTDSYTGWDRYHYVVSDVGSFTEDYLGWPLDKPDQPVVRVSWNDADRFCRWLSQRTGMSFSLPTEAQWEYACRAGTDTPFSYGGLDTDFSPFANLADASIRQLAYRSWSPRTAHVVPRDDRFDDQALVSAPVGSYRPNAWGLCDVHGNVAEWTRTSYRPYPYREDDGRNALDPKEPKVVRGGSWRDRPARCRSGFRLSYPPYQRVFNVGFRVVSESTPARRVVLTDPREPQLTTIAMCPAGTRNAPVRGSLRPRGGPLDRYRPEIRCKLLNRYRFRNRQRRIVLVGL